MMENFQNALRVIFASTIVQCCEAIDGNLARWRSGRAAARRGRT